MVGIYLKKKRKRRKEKGISTPQSLTYGTMSYQVCMI
jgi:hypothetical protein